MAPSRRLAGLSLLLASACPALVHAQPVEADESFEGFLDRHRLAYEGEERIMRMRLFEEARAFVVDHNLQEDKLWTATLNEHSVKTEAERRAMTGYVAHQLRPGANVLEGASRGEIEFPEQFDWRDRRPNVVTPVKDQGACASSWAFAAAAALETAVALQSQKLHDFSVQQLTSCTPHPRECRRGSGACRGGSAALAFQYAAEARLTTEWLYPFVNFRNDDERKCLPLTHAVRRPLGGVHGFRYVPRNDDIALMQAVLVNPVAVALDSRTMPPYQSGIFNGCSLQDPHLDHVAVLVGFGRRNDNYYWTVRNSWGALWGEAGYIRLLRRPGVEECGTDNAPWRHHDCSSRNRMRVAVCGTCGILSDAVFPTRGFAINSKDPDL